MERLTSFLSYLSQFENIQLIKENTIIRFKVESYFNLIDIVIYFPRLLNDNKPIQFSFEMRTKCPSNYVNSNKPAGITWSRIPQTVAF